VEACCSACPRAGWPRAAILPAAAYAAPTDWRASAAAGALLAVAFLPAQPAKPAAGQSETAAAAHQADAQADAAAATQ